MKTLRIIALSFSLILCECAVTGGIETQYGTVTSDGKRINIIARLPDQDGYRK